CLRIELAGPPRREDRRLDPVRVEQFDQPPNADPAAELALCQLHRRLVQQAAQQHRIEVEREVDRDTDPRRVAKVWNPPVPGSIGPSRLLQFREILVELADHEVQSVVHCGPAILQCARGKETDYEKRVSHLRCRHPRQPPAEVLERYVDPGFRPRLAELAPYRQASGEGRHHYTFGRKFYRRVLGEAAPREDFTGRESQWRGGKVPRPGVQDDQAENRVKDMDDEGTDIHFLIPGSFMSLVGLDDPAFEVGLIRAYHRHMADFCGRFPTRLKSLIVASTRDVEAAVHEI